MKKQLSKIILATLIATTSIVAQDLNDYSFNSYSLVGFEGGYSTFDVENTTASKKTSPSFGQGGIKIGAQTKNYRLFLSARHCEVDGFDYANTYGAEAQYLFNFSKYANLYLGVNAGKISMRMDSTEGTRTVSDTFLGGDIGVNIHLGETIDLELGARVIGLDISSTLGGVTYTFDNISTGYMSFIFKYQMD